TDVQVARLAEVIAVAKTVPAVFFQFLHQGFPGIVLGIGRLGQGFPVDAAHLAPVGGGGGQGADAEAPVAQAHQVGQVLQHAHLLAAEQGRADVAQGPGSPGHPELLQADVGARQAGLLLVVQEEAPVGDAQGELAVDQEFNFQPRLIPDQVDFVQVQLVGRAQDPDPVLGQSAGPFQGVQVDEAAGDEGQLGKVPVGQAQHAQALHIYAVDFQFGAYFQHGLHLGQGLTAGAGVGADVGLLALLLQVGDGGLQLVEVGDGIVPIEPAVRLAQVDAVEGGEICRL